MKQLRVSTKYSSAIILIAAAVSALFVAASQPVLADDNEVVVFYDNFSDGLGLLSTLNATNPAAPTPTSTDYEVLATKNATASSLSPGDLRLTLSSATCSGLYEVQAMFTTGPIKLVNSGDWIEMMLTFTDTSNMLAGANNSSLLSMGMFDSAGAYPIATGVLANAGLGGADTAITPHNAQLWQGYIASINVSASGNSQIIFRPQQSFGYNQGQDVLFNNATSSGAFNNPKGSIIKSMPWGGLAFTNGQTYTETLMYKLNADGTVLITNVLYLGSDTNGTVIFYQYGTTNNVITSGWDAFAFGDFQNKTTSAIPIEDVKTITILSNIPEPSTLLLAVGGLGLMIAVLRRRSH